MQNPQKSEPSSRFFILCLSCLAGLAIFYCGDTQSMIKEQIMQVIDAQYPGSADYYFNLMYSVYSLPNIILPIFAGVMIDKIGFNIPLVILGAFCALGTFIIWVGLKAGSVPFLLMGRFVFGLGAESQMIAISAVMVTWFKGKELAFASAVNLSVGRLGSVLNCYLSPYLVQYGISAPYAFGILVCLISSIATVLIATSKPPVVEEENSISQPQVAGDSSFSFKSIIKDISGCKSIFWVFMGLMTLLYLAYLPFNMIASSYFISRWYNNPAIPLEDREQTVGSLLSIPLILSSITFPLFGGLVDKFGKRVYLLMASSTLLSISYILFLEIPPLVPLIVLGLAYGLFGSIVWPTVAYLVPARIYGTAMGIISMAQNGSMTVFPILIAYIQTSSGDKQAMTALLINALISIYLSAHLLYLDSKRRVSLNSSDQTALTEAIESENLKAADLAKKGELAKNVENDEQAETLINESSQFKSLFVDSHPL